MGTIEPIWAEFHAAAAAAYWTCMGGGEPQRKHDWREAKTRARQLWLGQSQSPVRRAGCRPPP